MIILLFLFILFVLVLVHELGHFVVAKMTGMRVDEFGIGFPPRLFSIRRGETLYSFNWLPIGGFVRIHGENFEAEEATATERTGRAFTDKSRLAQAAVLLAGVTMNILFAWCLYAAVFMIGVPTVVDSDTASDMATLTITDVLPESPAAQADISRGAVVTAVSSGTDTLNQNTPAAFAAFVRTHSTDAITVTYQANNESHVVHVTPAENVLVDNTVPAVGVALALVDTVRYPIHLALYEGARSTFDTFIAITGGIGTLIGQAVTGNADLSDVAGPVGIVGLVGDAAQFGFASLVLFTALISLNLAVINLLPFPALDGGRLLFVAIEGITRRPLNPVWAGRANFIGFALLIVLMVVITFNDILRIV